MPHSMRSRSSYSQRVLKEGWSLSGIAEKAWGGLKSLASSAGVTVLDGAKWMAGKLKAAKNMSKKVLKFLTNMGAKLGGIVLAAIKKLPGGEIVLEFLEKVAGDLAGKIKKMQAAIGKQVEEFVNGAKKKLVDFFFTYVLKDDEMRKDFYGAMGLTEKDLSAVRTECRKLGINTLNELNLHLNRSRRLIIEVDVPEEVSEKIEDAVGFSPSDAKDAAKLMGFVDMQKGDDPEEIKGNLRGKAANVMEKIIDFWLKLVAKNPEKYHKPFYESGFFKMFGSTGFGLASASILGILAAGELKWAEVVQYVKSMVRGFEGGTSRPPGSTSNKAGAFLFLGNEGNNYNADLFKSFIKGIISGSNLEVIIRALSGDASQIPTLCKRLVGAIVGAVRQAIGELALATQIIEADPEFDSKEVGGDEGDDLEEKVNEAIEDYIDDSFASFLKFA